MLSHCKVFLDYKGSALLKLGEAHIPPGTSLPFKRLTKLHIQELIPSIKKKAPGQKGRRRLLFFPVMQEMEEIDFTPHLKRGPEECP